jgi:hypothetical protein
MLVGHSLGGLMLKQVCVEVEKRSVQDDGADKEQARAFIDSVKATAFYATPHTGSKLAYLTRVVPFFIGAVVDHLIPLAETTTELNANFDRMRKEKGWGTLAFFEHLPLCVNGVSKS